MGKDLLKPQRQSVTRAERSVDTNMGIRGL